MRTFARPRLWLGLWLAGWLLCIVLSLGHPLRLDVDVPDGDKIGHFLAYFVLSWWSMNLFSTRRERVLAALSLVALGVAMELAQAAFTSDRMMDIRDAVANTLGVIVGQGLALTPSRHWLQRLDRRWFA